MFPAPSGGSIATTTFWRMLRTCEIPAVPHGFRSSFRDWCAETGVPREDAESCVAHEVGNTVEGAYKRTDVLERRRRIMEDWAKYVLPSPLSSLSTTRRSSASSDS